MARPRPTEPRRRLVVHLPESLYRRIAEEAAFNHRTLSGQVAWYVERPSEELPPYGSTPALNARQSRLLTHIRKHGRITSGEYQELAGIVPDTAIRDLRDLLAQGLIEVRGLGRGTHYLLTAAGVTEADRLLAQG